MTEFEKRCAEACPEGCGKGLPRHSVGGLDARRLFHGAGMSQECTSPTESQYIEELVKDRDGYKLKYEHLDKLLVTQQVTIGIICEERDKFKHDIRNISAERDSLRQQRDAKQVNHEFACTVFASGPCTCGFSGLMQGWAATKADCDSLRDQVDSTREAYAALSVKFEQQQQEIEALRRTAIYFEKELDTLCSDCPSADYPTDKTRCAECPLREEAIRAAMEGK